MWRCAAGCRPQCHSTCFLRPAACHAAPWHITKSCASVHDQCIACPSTSLGRLHPWPSYCSRLRTSPHFSFVAAAPVAPPCVQAPVHLPGTAAMGWSGVRAPVHFQGLAPPRPSPVLYPPWALSGHRAGASAPPRPYTLAQRLSLELAHGAAGQDFERLFCRLLCILPSKWLGTSLGCSQRSHSKQ